MPDVRETDIKMRDSSTAQARLDAALCQPESEVAIDEQVVNLRVCDKGTQMGDDGMLWWTVIYEVTPKAAH
jgi:hypothetical protein